MHTRTQTQSQAFAQVPMRKQSSPGVVRARLLVRESLSSVLGLAVVFALAALPSAQQLTEQELIWPVTEAGNRFGFAVDMHEDRMIVGAWQGDSASIYHWSGNEWELETVFSTPNDPAVSAGNGHIRSVAIHGDFAVVGAYRRNRAYVLERQGEVWTHTASLVGSNTLDPDRFGYSVDLHGSTLAVGAVDFSISRIGAVYVFDRTPGGDWLESDFLLASNAGGQDNFGYAIALDEDRLAVGARGEDGGSPGVNGDQNDNSRLEAGAVYLFDRTAQGWVQSAYIKPLIPGSLNRFGESLDLFGDQLLVGAPYESSAATGINGGLVGPTPATFGSGAAYLFTLQPGGWTQELYIKASNTGSSAFVMPNFGPHFGWNVAIHGDFFAVGAPLEDGVGTGIDGTEELDTNLDRDSGACYVFRKENGTWTQAHYVKSRLVSFGAEFGYATAMSDRYLVIGAIRSGDRVETFELQGPLARSNSRSMGANAESLSAAPSVLGAHWTVEVDLSTTGHVLGQLMFFLEPTVLGPILNDQWLLVGPNFPRGELFGLAPLAGPLAQLSLTLPNSSALAGQTFHTQAVQFGNVAPFALSNALELRIGFP